MTTIATTCTTTSADGTTIGYRQLGTGPGLVVVHGAMSSGYNHVELANLLADRFTVYLVDRRGRGLSGPYHPADGLQSEVDDLVAVLDQTGACDVFGVSSGAIISLEAALRRPALRRLSIFEPPIFADQDEPRHFLARFDEQLARGAIARAMVVGMKGAQMGPAIMRKIPDGLLAWLTSRLLKGEARKPPSEYVPTAALVPAMHHDFQVVVEASGPPTRYAAIQAEVQLLGASLSPAYLKDALTALHQVMPTARRQELPGLDHAASWNADRGGKPAPVASALAEFFASESGD